MADSESQWESARPQSTHDVVPVVPQSQGDLHSEFFSSSGDSGKAKQSQTSGQNTKPNIEPADENTNNTPTTSPTNKKDTISPKARRHLEFNLEKDANLPTESQPAPSKKPSGIFKFTLPNTSSGNPKKHINLSTNQSQLPRTIAPSAPKFGRQASPSKENAPKMPSINSNDATSPAQSPTKRHTSQEKSSEKEVTREVEEDKNIDAECLDLEIISEQRQPEHDVTVPIIRVNSPTLQVTDEEETRQRKRSRSNSPSPKENRNINQEENEDHLKSVISLDDLSPRFFNKTKTSKRASKDRSLASGSAPSSQDIPASPKEPSILSAKQAESKTASKKGKGERKSLSPNSKHPGSLGDLIRQSRQQTLASKDPTMEFVIGYFKEANSDTKQYTSNGGRSPKFSSITNSTRSAATVGVKRKIDYYGWLDLTSNKKQKIDYKDQKN